MWADWNNNIENAELCRKICKVNQSVFDWIRILSLKSGRSGYIRFWCNQSSAIMASIILDPRVLFDKNKKPKKQQQQQTKIETKHGLEGQVVEE